MAAPSGRVIMVNVEGNVSEIDTLSPPGTAPRAFQNETPVTAHG